MIKISGFEHLTASEQPEVLEVLLDIFEGRSSDYLKYSKTSTKYSMPTGLGYEELGGLSDPGQRDCL